MALACSTALLTSLGSPFHKSPDTVLILLAASLVHEANARGVVSAGHTAHAKHLYEG